MRKCELGVEPSGSVSTVEVELRGQGSPVARQKGPETSTKSHAPGRGGWEEEAYYHQHSLGLTMTDQHLYLLTLIPQRERDHNIKHQGGRVGGGHL